MIPLLRARARMRRTRGWMRARLGGSFFGPVLTLVAGAAAAQAVVFAARPVLTRLFTPEAFGVLTLFVAVVALVDTFRSGRYEDALMLPEREEEGANVLALALLLSTTTAVLAAVAALAREPVARLLGSPELAPSLLLLPPTVLLAGWTTAAETWHTRRERFRVVSAGRLAQGAAVVAVQLTAGALGGSALGLTAGAAVGFAAAAAVSMGSLLRRDGHLLRTAVRAAAMRRLARRYAQFPRWAAPAVLLNALASRLPVFLLAAFFSTEVVGYFGVAFGTLALPVGLLTGAVGQVFFVRATGAQRRGTLGAMTTEVHARIVALALFPSLAVAVAGPEAFAFVFGEPWRTAGHYARALAAWTFFTAVAVPLTRVFDVTERQRSNLVFGAALFIVQAAVLVVAGQHTPPLTAVAWLGAAGAVMRMLQVGWLLRLAGTPLSRALRDLLRQAALAAPLLLPLALANAAGSGPLVLTAMVLGGLGYLALAARANRRAAESRFGPSDPQG